MLRYNLEELQPLLQVAGLTELEIKIYLYILRKGKISATKIYQSLHLDKSSTYRILDSLVSRGLISLFGDIYAKEYMITDTSVLLQQVNEKSKQLRDAESKLSKIFSTLETTLLKDYKNHNIQVYEGAEGVKIIWEKRLHAKDKVIREIANSKTLREFFPDYLSYMNEYIQRRVKKGIYLRGLVPTDGIHELDKTSKENLKEIRILPKSNNFIATVTTFDNVTAFHNLKGKRLIGVVIVDEFITNLINYLFEQLWENARTN